MDKNQPTPAQQASDAANLKLIARFNAAIEAVCMHSETIGEGEWYTADELHKGPHISAVDASLIELCSPANLHVLAHYAARELTAAQGVSDSYDDGTGRVRDYSGTQPTEPQGAVVGKYDEVLRPFLVHMELELHANAGKGDRPGWLAMDAETCLLEIYYHVAKLQKAVRNSDGDRIKENTADVANMAMMLLDICGGLEA